MKYEDLQRVFPEDEKYQSMPQNEEEILQQMNKAIDDNKPIFKKIILRIVIFIIAFNIANIVLASIIKPYATIDEDGHRAASSDAAAILIGLTMIVSTAWVLIRKRTRCTQKVTAYIIEDENQQTSNGTMYKSIYEYYYNGQIFRTASNVLTSTKTKGQETVNLRINPNNPQEVLDKKYVSFFCIILLMGLVILSASLIPILIRAFGH